VIGQIVDGHEIVRALGGGGMGEVYLARTATGVQRAIKIMRERFTDDPVATARFTREVRLHSRLQHPGIVQVHDVGQLAGGEMWFSMEFVAGVDLQTKVDRGGPLSVADALRVLVQLAEAIAFAHDLKVIHRDLKPANVLLADGDPGRAKVIDFGLAKLAGGETRLTATQQMVGSPLYWAPEQTASAQVGGEADIYALGGIAYFALTGVPLFRARTPVSIVYAHVHETPEPIAVRCPDLELPPGLDELVQACVAKAPADRPSAAQLVAELGPMLARAPTTSRASRPPRLFTGSGASDMEQAVTSQIRQIVLELAGVLGRPTDAIDRIQNELEQLELDLAMLDSEVDAAFDPTVEHEHEHVAARVAELQRALTAAFRDLVDVVLADRERANDEAAPLYIELDALFAQYRGL
jgi:serine/threonine-protein kinase